MVPAELINTLLILGAAQGLFLGAVLAARRANSAANKLLAVAMFAFSVFILQSVYYARGYYAAYPHFIGVSQPLVFLFGPLLYLYAQTVSTGGHTFRRVSLVHFVPFGLVTLYLVPFYLQEGTAKAAYMEALLRDGPPLDLAIIEQLQYPYGILYVALTIGLLRRYRARLKDTYSSTERINLLWLRNLTVGVVAVWALATGLNLLEVAGLGAAGLEAQLTALAVSVFVYGIGYLGLRQPEIFHPLPPPVERQGGAVDGPPALGAREALPAPPDERSGYGKSGLTQAQAEAHMQELLRLMDAEQPYKRSLLTLPELAEELSISVHNLSEVINTQAGKNFYDFVNGYRLEEAKRRLRDPDTLHLTILAIAEESGFNSKSTFNTFFRKHTGLTPSQYRARHGVEA